MSCGSLELSGVTCHAETITGADGLPVSVTSTAPDKLSSSRDWMNTWTIFYWGWWIAWAPFVGMFIAKISRGRTVRQIINGALTGPVIYSFFWFAIFGGTALRIERQAANLGISCELGGDGETLLFSRVTESGTLPLEKPMVELGGREFWRLSCRDSTDMWFDVFANYPLHKYALLPFSLSYILVPSDNILMTTSLVPMSVLVYRGQLPLSLDS